MQGKTHISIAAGIGLLSNILLGGTHMILPTVVFSSLGGILPDIDMDNSKISHLVEVAVGFLFSSLFIGVILAVSRVTPDFELEINMDPYVMGPLVLFIVLALIGKRTKHRSFMHSLLALVLFTYTIKPFANGYWIYFMLGYISHLGIDLLNRKSERLLFPFKFGLLSFHSLAVIPNSATFNTSASLA